MNIKKIFLLAFVAFISRAANADNSFVLLPMPEEVIPTPYGMLQLKEITGEVPIFKLMLGDKELGQMQPDYSYADFVAVYPDEKVPRYLLIQLNTGGSGCRDFYRLVDLNDKDSAKLSDEFGNCNEISKMESKDGKWYFTIPPTRNEDKAEVWVYSEGNVTLITSEPRRKKPRSSN